MGRIEKIMPDISSKMRLRAQIMRTLSKYRDNANPLSEDIAQDIKKLSEIKDKKYLARLLFKEIKPS